MPVQGVWSAICPRCGRWDLEPPAFAVVKSFERKEVLATRGLLDTPVWVEENYFDKTLRPAGWRALARRTVPAWRVRLHDGREIEITQQGLIELFEAARNPTVETFCPFCGAKMKKFFIQHIP